MTLKHTFRALTAALLIAGMASTGMAQTNLGEACGCPDVSLRASVNLSTLADVDGVLTAENTVLDCSTIWVIDDKIYVDDQKSLTIAPGTVLQGVETVAGPNSGNALIVSRGGKIFAPGTRECPIVFTSTDDNLDGTYGVENSSKWGGVVLLGKAFNNLPATGNGSGDLNTGTAGVGFIEGFTAANPFNQFGAPAGQDDPNDNSGIMTFCSIRHAGDIVGNANELNGLTLGSVGRGTTLQHIEIVSNIDDGIEFFGGTVDLKYAAILTSGDDGFDWDLGYRGRIQFGVVVKTDQNTASGDNGLELDGDDDNTAEGNDYGNPRLYNATLFGANGVNPTIGASVDGNVGFELKEATRGEIKNCIVAGWNTGVQFADESRADGLGDTYNLWRNEGLLVLENNTFVGTTDLIKGNGVTLNAADTAFFLADGNTAVASIAGLNPVHDMNVTNNTVIAKHDMIPGADDTNVSTPPVDGFFTPVTYRGAFKVGEKSWLSDYSFRALIGLEGALIPCETDINTDGSTNTSDFLLLLGAFGTDCD